MMNGKQPIFYVPILHTEREVSLIQSGEGHAEKVHSIKDRSLI